METTDLPNDRTPSAASASRPRLRLALIALVLTIAGPFAYMFLMTYPWMRSTGAPAFVLMAVGSMLGIRALMQDRRLLTRCLGAVSPLLTALFVYIFFWGLILPETTKLDTLGVAPEFVLPDEEGRRVSLSEVVDDGPTLLVFYRGYW